MVPRVYNLICLERADSILLPREPGYNSQFSCSFTYHDIISLAQAGWGEKMHPGESRLTLIQLLAFSFVLFKDSLWVIQISLPASAHQKWRKKQILQSEPILTKATYWINLVLALHYCTFKKRKYPPFLKYNSSSFLYAPNKLSEGYNFSMLKSQIINSIH